MGASYGINGHISNCVDLGGSASISGASRHAGQYGDEKSRHGLWIRIRRDIAVCHTPFDP